MRRFYFLMCVIGTVIPGAFFGAFFAANGLDAASIIGSQFSFVSEIGRQAQAKGLNPITAQAAAAAMWENFLKGQGK